MPEYTRSLVLIVDDPDAPDPRVPTRAFGPDHPALPAGLRDAGQPVLIGGTMATASCILAGTREGMGLAYGSACHGAGRSMSRRQASRQWNGNQVKQVQASQGILIRSPSMRPETTRMLAL